jgi:hypothetical protein
VRHFLLHDHSIRTPPCTIPPCQRRFSWRLPRFKCGSTNCLHRSLPPSLFTASTAGLSYHAWSVSHCGGWWRLSVDEDQITWTPSRLFRLRCCVFVLVIFSWLDALRSRLVISGEAMQWGSLGYVVKCSRSITVMFSLVSLADMSKKQALFPTSPEIPNLFRRRENTSWNTLLSTYIRCANEAYSQTEMPETREVDYDPPIHFLYRMKKQTILSRYRIYTVSVCYYIRIPPCFEPRGRTNEVHLHTYKDIERSSTSF